jgi:hypothetical protein
MLPFLSIGHEVVFSPPHLRLARGDTRWKSLAIFPVSEGNDFTGIEAILHEHSKGIVRRDLKPPADGRPTIAGGDQSGRADDLEGAGASLCGAEVRERMI